LSKTHQQHSF